MRRPMLYSICKELREMWFFIPTTKRVKKILRWLRKYNTHQELVAMLNEIDGFDDDIRRF